MTSTGAAAGFFDGTLDEARIWNVARSGAQILSGRDQQISTATGLVGRWGFDTRVRPGDGLGRRRPERDAVRHELGVGHAGAPFSGTPNAAPVPNAGLDFSVILPASRVAGRIVHR